MGTILDKIIAQKKLEVADLQRSGFRYEEVRPHVSLVENLKKPGVTVIAEIKRASPSKGALNLEVDVQEQAKQYELSGAGAISVLTDTNFFKGSFQDLKDARSVVSVPLLCKDFIIDEVQIQKANEAGADIILLIVAALPGERLQELYRYATELGLEVIVEVHDEEELEAALAIGPAIIGVNNRNLRTFEVNLETTERLAKRVVSSGALLISESGIFTKEDVVRVQRVGAQGILVGEAFMRADSVADLFGALRI
ncbi:indole-3-glycerol phosphate synthase TrpC [Ectobacillus sp. JY-23]|uniref:indole-3-glycerol phosphate synthase TrpC n=1 Tax=Ectobacillus sp. JY-23 TaxID=2933872 RepID=UPI001FF1B35F|nr:indole-3-glycerol phosphate synthase TrpC [Ectobacillus sp. JY-23]UOY92191.1 indole-3-glycerol phosphate synthase TrpC [Ectobacillus sp. JY-23]